MNRHEGSVAIVTGGGNGIGRASALRLASEGASVCVADLDGAAAQDVGDEIAAHGGRALAIAVDVSEASQVEEMVTRSVAAFGRLDTLHNNAADTSVQTMSADIDVADFDPELLDRVFAVNLRGPMLGCKYAIPHMIDNGGGAIVNTSSIGALRGMPVRPIYAMTKAAMNCLTMYVATQYGKRGIRCNAVAPGPVRTPAYDVNVTQEQDLANLRGVSTPRIGTPEDIAAAVSYLASAEAAFITGQTIVIDGGGSVVYR